MPESVRILIVEDSPAMRQLLTMAVKKLPSVEVVEAPDGLAALKALAGGRFDLLLVDLNMPVLDGMKLIRRVREAEAPSVAEGARPMRICVITTESTQATEDQARALGADYFLRKPVNRRDVDKMLAEALPG
jgi:two-component system chemotaxis response regulator CheY